MPSNRTSVRAEAAEPTLADLDHTELTVALGASDMPTRVRDVPRGQLAAWAQQGLDRLGLQGVRETAARTADLEYAARGTGMITAGGSAELRDMWPSVQRLDTAHDGAYELRKQLAADLLGLPDMEVSYSAQPAGASIAEADPAEVEAEPGA